jgi:hypothetical protein
LNKTEPNNEKKDQIKEKLLQRIPKRVEEYFDNSIKIDHFQYSNRAQHRAHSKRYGYIIVQVRHILQIDIAIV